MAKIIENTFRHVNIALVNELAMIAPDLGIDIWEALDAAATKPYGFMPFYPGPGVGGHCIPIDPSYLSWRVGQRRGHRVNFVEHAQEVNARMPDYVGEPDRPGAQRPGQAAEEAKVLAIGVTFKANVNDVRESAPVASSTACARQGATISYHDPLVPELTSAASASVVEATRGGDRGRRLRRDPHRPRRHRLRRRGQAGPAGVRRTRGDPPPGRATPEERRAALARGAAGAPRSRVPLGGRSSSPRARSPGVPSP